MIRLMTRGCCLGDIITGLADSGGLGEVRMGLTHRGGLAAMARTDCPGDTGKWYGCVAGLGTGVLTRFIRGTGDTGVMFVLICLVDTGIFGDIVKAASPTCAKADDLSVESSGCTMKPAGSGL